MGRLSPLFFLNGMEYVLVHALKGHSIFLMTIRFKILLDIFETSQYD